MTNIEKEMQQIEDLFGKAGLPHPRVDETSHQLLNEILLLISQATDKAKAEGHKHGFSAMFDVLTPALRPYLTPEQFADLLKTVTSEGYQSTLEAEIAKQAKIEVLEELLEMGESCGGSWARGECQVTRRAKSKLADLEGRGEK